MGNMETDVDDDAELLDSIIESVSKMLQAKKVSNAQIMKILGAMLIELADSNEVSAMTMFHDDGSVGTIKFNFDVDTAGVDYPNGERIH